MNCSSNRPISVMVFGVGSFAQSIAGVMRDNGADVSTYLTRNYGHYPPSLVGPTFTKEAYPNPCTLLREKHIDLVMPMSIDWAQAPWSEELIQMGVPILSPVHQAMKIERERDF